LDPRGPFVAAAAAAAAERIGTPSLLDKSSSPGELNNFYFGPRGPFVAAAAAAAAAAAERIGEELLAY
jgi:hypothetical protein